MTLLAEFAGFYPSRGTLPAAANVAFERGTILQVNATSGGQGTPGAAGNSFKAVGIVRASVDNRTGSEAGGAAGAIDVEYDVGIFGIASSLVTGTIKPGDLGYVLGPTTVTATAGTNGILGRCTEVRNGKHYFMISPLSV